MLILKSHDRTTLKAPRSLALLTAAVALCLTVSGNSATADSDEVLVELKTAQGSIFIEFFPEDAPNHVNHFIELTESGFYDGTVFHRIINNFILQGGDPNTISGHPNTWGLGGADKKLDAEFNTIEHAPGIVSMARTADPDSASSQFFIVDRAGSNFLNGQYTVFGRLATEGSFQTLDKILATPISLAGWSLRPIYPEQARIESAAVVPRSDVPDLLDLPEPVRTPEIMAPLNDTQIASVQREIPFRLPVESTPTYPGFGVRVETVASNLQIPWGIDWTPDGTAIFTERTPGTLKMIQNGTVSTLLFHFPANTLGGGMLGVAVDPNFEENNYIYLYQTYDEGDDSLNRVVRYTLLDDSVAERFVVIDRIPGSIFENGGRIQFGPDGYLYITTGFAGMPFSAQDPNSLAGKILRISPNGTIPEDNPFEGSPVWSIGHRHAQGIDWDAAGNLVATEHGPSGWRGADHDEINLIVPGANYGWPDIIGDEAKEGMRTPIISTGNETWAPSGAEFYDGDKIPEWTGKYFVATLRGTHLHMLDLDLENNVVVSHSRLFLESFGRLRDVQTGPDGYLYLLTSNQDGRLTPAVGDDRILRIVPLSEPADFAEANTFTSDVVYEGMIEVEDTEHLLGYNITGGELLTVVANTAAASLVASINAAEDGSLTLDIPRIVADAKIPGEPDYRVPDGMLKATRYILADAAYLVWVDGEEAGFGEQISPISRTLTIEFHAGANVIEIVGSSVVGQNP